MKEITVNERAPTDERTPKPAPEDFVDAYLWLVERLGFRADERRERSAQLQPS